MIFVGRGSLFLIRKTRDKVFREPRMAEANYAKFIHILPYELCNVMAFRNEVIFMDIEFRRDKPIIKVTESLNDLW